MTDKTGILLVNLGSPDTPSPEDVRRYLGQFLHDHRVIDTSRWIWCPILHGIILRVRPKKSGAKYASVWNEPAEYPGTEAPLVRITRAQGEALKAIATDAAPLEIGMRYGSPSIESAMQALGGQGCTHIKVLPLYPQFSHTTTSAVEDALKAAKDVPTWTMLDEYHVHPEYIEALKQNLETHIASLSWTPDVVLTSYHGLPKRYVDQGDPYADQCRATTKDLKAVMGETSYDIQLTFQSRFGPMEWLQPYTDKTLEALAAQGKKNIVVMTPGFAADCLETLEEIALEAHEMFEEAGGENFSVVPCLNTDNAHIEMMATLIKDMELSA